STFHNNRAVAFFQSQNWPEAQREANDGLYFAIASKTVTQKTMESQYLIGFAKVYQGRKDEAKGNFTEALEVYETLSPTAKSYSGANDVAEEIKTWLKNN